jgi:hypothetical protein
MISGSRAMSATEMISAETSGMAHRQPEAVGRGFEDFGLQRHAVAQVGDDHDGDIEFAADQQVLEIAAIVLDGLTSTPGQARR